MDAARAGAARGRRHAARRGRSRMGSRGGRVVPQHRAPRHRDRVARLGALGARRGHRARGGPLVFLPLSRRRRDERRRQDAHDAATRSGREDAPRFRSLPAVRAGLVRRLSPHGRGRSRSRHPSGRLHLRVLLGPGPRAQARHRGAVDARRIPRPLRALQERPRSPVGARCLPLACHVGRSRGSERLRERPVAVSR